MVSRKKITLIAVLVFIIIGIASAITGMSYLKSDGYCKYCHSKPDMSNDTLAIRHNALKIACYDCHAGDFADARMKEVLNYTLGYKGKINGKVVDRDCQKCHYGNISTKVLPHYYASNCTVCHPAHGIFESPETSLDCYICHAPKAMGGKHAEIDCVECHSEYLFDAEKHAYIPECSECHVPHTNDMKTRSDCMQCHPAHSPTSLKAFSQNISKSFCAICHIKEYNTLTSNNQKHNYYNGSWFELQDPNSFLYFNYTCTGCHPAHGSAKGCAFDGCHRHDHMNAHDTDCIACHRTGYPPKLNCSDCHADPHTPLPAVGYPPKIKR